MTAPTPQAEATPAPQPGSERYYTLLYEPPARARAAHALLGIHELIAGTPPRCSDRGIARVRLAWLHEELERLASGQSRHPLFQALPGTMSAAPAVALLRACVSAVEAEVDGEPPADLDDLHARCLAMDGSLWRCWALLLGVNDPAGQDTMQQAGALNGRWRILRDLRQDLDAGYQRLPTALLQSARAAAAEPSNPAFDGFLADTDDALARLLAGWPRQAHRDLLAPRIALRLQLRTQQLNRRSGAQMLLQRAELTPLQRLFIAWRERWRGPPRHDPPGNTAPR